MKRLADMTEQEISDLLRSASDGLRMDLPADALFSIVLADPTGRVAGYYSDVTSDWERIMHSATTQIP